MGNLNHFDERTIRRVRDRYTGGKIGSGDDPIATHTKMIQDHYLGNLEKLAARAENRAYDTNAGLQGEVDTRAEIDPTLSYDENVALLKEDLNVTFRTEAYKAERDAQADEKDKTRRHAARSLRTNFDAIEAGEKSQLVDDIGAELSPAFVDDVLAVERAERASDTGSLPEPEPEPVEAAPEPEPTPEPVEVTPEPVEPTPEPEPTPERVSTTPAESSTRGAGAAVLARLSDVADSLELFAAFIFHLIGVSVNRDESAEKSAYHGVMASIRLALAYPLAQYHVGMSEAATAAPTDDHQATLTAY